MINIVPDVCTLADLLKMKKKDGLGYKFQKIKGNNRNIFQNLQSEIKHTDCYGQKRDSTTRSYEAPV